MIRLILLLFLTACASVSNTGTASGKQGVELKFGALPNNVIYFTESTEEPVLIEGYNYGSEPAEVDGYFTGYDPTLISLYPDEIHLSFDEDMVKSRYLDYGYETGGNIVIKPLSALQDIDSYEATLLLQYCYEYTTDANILICIDPTPARNSKEDACTPGKVTTAGQAAPVTIDSVDVESAKDRVRLTMKIKKHQGDLITSDTECRGITPKYNVELVEYESIELGRVSPSGCSSNSPLRLRDDVADLSCTFQLDGESAYSTILNVKLRYFIKDEIEKNIKIVNAEER